MIFSLYIINKAGGLIYQKDFNEGLAKLSSNEYLVLAGTFHRYFENARKIYFGDFISTTVIIIITPPFIYLLKFIYCKSVHAITSKISPVKTSTSSGLEVLEADIFKLYCYQTLTGED